MGILFWIVISLFLLFLVALFVALGVKIVRAWEKGIFMMLGKFRSLFDPGFHWIPPFISQLVRMDLRTQTWEVPKQEVITKDNSPTGVDAVIYIKVVDAKKAFFEVQDYSLATLNLARTTLRSVIGNMELDEILYNRERINTKLRDLLDQATDKWGVRVEAVEIREVDPAAAVKKAMEDQTSAERERRAAILTADGVRRSLILKAEGEKRSKILVAEGTKQAKILEAQGERLATILNAQGEAQRLRLLSLGSATLDPKSLSVISMDTIAKVSNGQATKIIYPFEISKLVETASEYLGGGKGVRETTPTNYIEVEKIVGTAKDVLGPIPTMEELDKSLEDEKKDSTQEDEKKKTDSKENKEIEEK